MLTTAASYLRFLLLVMSLVLAGYGQAALAQQSGAEATDTQAATEEAVDSEADKKKEKKAEEEEEPDCE